MLVSHVLHFSLVFRLCSSDNRSCPVPGCKGNGLPAAPWSWALGACTDSCIRQHPFLRDMRPAESPYLAAASCEPLHAQADLQGCRGAGGMLSVSSRAEMSCAVAVACAAAECGSSRSCYGFLAHAAVPLFPIPGLNATFRPFCLQSVMAVSNLGRMCISSIICLFTHIVPVLNCLIPDNHIPCGCVQQANFWPMHSCPTQLAFAGQPMPLH